MAKKPPICLSKAIPIIPPLTGAKVRIVWFNDSAPPNPIDIDQTVKPIQDPEDPTAFIWDDPTAGANALRHVQLTAPLDDTYNALIVQARDEYEVMHYSENYFEPAQPPPFTQEVPCVSYDYPAPGTITAFITPG